MQRIAWVEADRAVRKMRPMSGVYGDLHSTSQGPRFSGDPFACGTRIRSVKNLTSLACLSTGTKRCPFSKLAVCWPGEGPPNSAHSSCLVWFLSVQSKPGNLIGKFDHDRPTRLESTDSWSNRPAGSPALRGAKSKCSLGFQCGWRAGLTVGSHSNKLVQRRYRAKSGLPPREGVDGSPLLLATLVDVSHHFLETFLVRGSGLQLPGNPLQQVG